MLELLRLGTARPYSCATSCDSQMIFNRENTKSIESHLPALPDDLHAPLLLTSLRDLQRSVTSIMKGTANNVFGSVTATIPTPTTIIAVSEHCRIVLLHSVAPT